jgi:hypothetical protein
MLAEGRSAPKVMVVVATQWSGDDCELLHVRNVSQTLDDDPCAADVLE